MDADETRPGLREVDTCWCCRHSIDHDWIEGVALCNVERDRDERMLVRESQPMICDRYEPQENHDDE